MVLFVQPLSLYHLSINAAMPVLISLSRAEEHDFSFLDTWPGYIIEDLMEAAFIRRLFRGEINWEIFLTSRIKRAIIPLRYVWKSQKTLSTCLKSVIINSLWKFIVSIAHFCRLLLLQKF